MNATLDRFLAETLAGQFALPERDDAVDDDVAHPDCTLIGLEQIGRASCRERV